MPFQASSLAMVQSTRDLQHVARLDPRAGQADGVVRQDLLRERHGMGSHGEHLFVCLSQHRDRL